MGLKQVMSLHWAERGLVYIGFIESFDGLHLGFLKKEVRRGVV